MTKKKQPPALPEGIRPQKRDRKVKDKPPSPNSPGNGKPSIVDGEGKLSPGVPDAIKAAVAEAIMAHSAIDAFLEFFIWDITGLSYDDGRILTQVDASRKIKIAKALAKRYGVEFPLFGPTKKTLWSVMIDLAEARNAMAHGVWGMHELTIPVVSSFRWMEDGQDGRVIAEGFDLRRLKAITAQCENAKECLEKMGFVAQVLRQKLVEQFLREMSKKTPQPPRDPQ